MSVVIGISLIPLKSTFSTMMYSVTTSVTMTFPALAESSFTRISTSWNLPVLKSSLMARSFFSSVMRSPLLKPVMSTLRALFSWLNPTGSMEEISLFSQSCACAQAWSGAARVITPIHKARDPGGRI